MRISLVVILILTALTAAGVGAGAWLTIETRQNRLVWDHFDVVKRGFLYRSGQLNADQLEKAVKQYGIRTLISFQFPGEGVEAERTVARRLKIDFVNLPMPGDGFGKKAQFREVLAAVDDPARRPVLIHCARGTCRTGSAVALYRFERDGWTIGDVAAEMRRQSYRDGWIPGYIYNMVTTRPGAERFEPQVVRDRNLPPPTAHEKPPPRSGDEHTHEIANGKGSVDVR
jgi:protein tyrosine/serine phosphatase